MPFERVSKIGPYTRRAPGESLINTEKWTQNVLKYSMPKIDCTGPLQPDRKLERRNSHHYRILLGMQFNAMLNEYCLNRHVLLFSQGLISQPDSAEYAPQGSAQSLICIDMMFSFMQTYASTDWRHAKALSGISQDREPTKQTLTQH